MEYKLFMKRIDEHLAAMDSQQLKTWIHNYARTVNEKERNIFLATFQKEKTESHTDEIHKIQIWCDKIDKMEITLTCQGYEDYSLGYWSSDWIYEYEDEQKIGEFLKWIYDFAEKCVYEGDYKDARFIYENVSTMVFYAEDADTEEIVELELEELVSEKIVRLNLKKIALLTLYVEYQLNDMKDCVKKMFPYFSWDMFDKIKVEDVNTVGPEELKDFEMFMEYWIIFLRDKTETYATRLLEEAVYYLRGNEGMLEEAKKNVCKHPAIYEHELLRLFEEKSYEKVVEEGLYATSNMNQEWMIRGRIAKISAVAAENIGNEKAKTDLRWEAFYSEVSIVNYLNLFSGERMKEQVTVQSEKRIDDVWKNRNNNCFNGETKEFLYNCLDKLEYTAFEFFMGRFEAVYQKCMKQKQPLGWSCEPIQIGVPLLLALLYQKKSCEKGIQILLGELEHRIGIKREYNDLTLWEYIQIWKQNKNIPEKDLQRYMNYLKKTIDKRVIAIVSEKHRGSYHKAALLVSGIGEVTESTGIIGAKAKTIDYYAKMFSRHSAFRGELKQLL